MLLNQSTIYKYLNMTNKNVQQINPILLYNDIYLKKTYNNKNGIKLIKLVYIVIILLAHII